MQEFLTKVNLDCFLLLFKQMQIQPNTYGRILKANFSWSPTRTKFCLLIESLSVTLPQFKLTKLKLEYLKFIFYCKKERYNHEQKIFTSLESDFFRIQLKLAFRIRRL